MDLQGKALADQLASGLKLLERFNGLENLRMALSRHDKSVASGNVLTLNPTNSLINGQQAKAARAVIRLMAKRPVGDR